MLLHSSEPFAYTLHIHPIVITRLFLFNFHTRSRLHLDNLYSLLRSHLSCHFPQEIVLGPSSSNSISPLQVLTGSSNSTCTDSSPSQSTKPAHCPPVLPTSANGSTCMQWPKTETQMPSLVAPFLFPTSIWSPGFSVKSAHLSPSPPNSSDSGDYVTIISHFLNNSLLSNFHS